MKWRSALLQAGLGTMDDTGVADLRLFSDDDRRWEFDWKRVLRDAEADFQAGKDLEVRFDWPAPVPPNQVVVSAIEARLGKPDTLTTIAGQPHLEYRFSNGATITFVVSQGRVLDLLHGQQFFDRRSLRSAVEARLGKPQGIIRVSNRQYLDYNLNGGKTLSLIVSDDTLLGIGYGKTHDLRALAGLEVTIDGTVNPLAKPGDGIETHRGVIYFTFSRENAALAYDGKRVKATGVLAYNPPYPGPLPWPPAQIPPEGYCFDANSPLRIEPAEKDRQSGKAQATQSPPSQPAR